MLDGMDAYEDNLWSFFMNCWHVKDWVKNEERLQAVRDDVVRAAHASPTLKVCQALANGIKHLELDPKRLRDDDSRARVFMYTFTHLDDGSVQWEHMIKLDDSSVVTVYEVGCAALREWHRIFDTYNLPMPQGWQDRW